jgi:hypothetical protein
MPPVSHRLNHTHLKTIFRNLSASSSQRKVTVSAKVTTGAPMATLTLTIDPAVLEAARLEAARRQITLDQLISDSLASIANAEADDDHGHADLVRLMALSPLGDIGELPTREEIYAERLRWPRS